MKKIYYFILMLTVLCSCDKDETITYPIYTSYQGTVDEDPIRVFVKTNDELKEISADVTNLDESPEWDSTLMNGSFEFINFTSETDAVSRFDPSFSIVADSIHFNYSYDQNELLFDTDFGSPAPISLLISGSPKDFSIASEIIMLRTASSNNISLIPNYYLSDASAYADFMDIGDTLLIMNYWQRYAE